VKVSLVPHHTLLDTTLYCDLYWVHLQMSSGKKFLGFWIMSVWGICTLDVSFGGDGGVWESVFDKWNHHFPGHSFWQSRASPRWDYWSCFRWRSWSKFVLLWIAYPSPKWLQSCKDSKELHLELWWKLHCMVVSYKHHEVENAAVLGIKVRDNLNVPPVGSFKGGKHLILPNSCLGYQAWFCCSNKVHRV